MLFMYPWGKPGNPACYKGGTEIRCLWFDSQLEIPPPPPPPKKLLWLDWLLFLLKIIFSLVYLGETTNALERILTRSPIHHFETVPNSKKLQTTT